MKSNKEIKNLSTEDSIKEIFERLNDLSEEVTETKYDYGEWCIKFDNLVNQLKSEILQKIKELENENKKLEWAKKYLNKEIYILNPEEWKQVEQLKKFYIENNQLKSQLKDQTGIKERIEELEIGLKENPDLIGEYLSRISELKSLLENEVK